MEYNNNTVQQTALTTSVTGLIHWFSKFSMFSNLYRIIALLMFQVMIEQGNILIKQRPVDKDTLTFQ